MLLAIRPDPISLCQLVIKSCCLNLILEERGSYADQCCFSQKTRGSRSAKLRNVLFAILDEIERQREEAVTKNEFRELTAIVGELAEAQKSSQAEIKELRVTMAELAEAQKETRQTLNELAEAQKSSQAEIKELRVTMAELAEAQKETRQTLNELAEAQKRSQEEIKELRVTMAELAEAQKETRQIVNELAEAQKRSQEEMKELRVAMTELAAAQRETHRQMIEGDRRLESELKKTRTELGGLSETVGISLEDRALQFLPELLSKGFDFTLTNCFMRKWVTDKKGEPLELDFIGEAAKNGDRFIVIGEAKAHLSKNKIDDFLRKKLKPLAGVYEAELFPIVMTFKTSGIEVEEYARQNGIKRIYYSHEFTDRPRLTGP